MAGISKFLPDIQAHFKILLFSISVDSFKYNLFIENIDISSVQLLSRVQLFATPWTAACQVPCPSPTPKVYSNSCPLSWWCHPTISSSVVPFSPRLQSFPASGSFSMSQLFVSGDQSIGPSSSASVLPMNIQNLLTQ